MNNDDNLTPALTTIRRGRVLIWAGLVLVLAGVVRALYFTPIEAVQGPAQKIFYLHVPAAWTTFLAYVLVGICSGLYLWLRDPRLDLFAEASAEVGTMLACVLLTTGPIWGKPIWGTWWQWDPRLTSTLFLFFLFVGYLALRSAVYDPAERARYSAVVGILGALLVPFVHLTVYMFRTIHPLPVIARPDGPTAPWSMLSTMLLALLAFSVLYLGLVTTRYGLGRLRDAREAAHAAHPG